MDARQREEVERLYRAHYSEVRRHLLRSVGDTAEAEDLAQDAFLNALTAIERGTRPHHPRPWLYAIADNVRRRRYVRQPPRPAPLDAVPDVAAPEQGAEAHELVDALRTLPPAQLQALVLRDFAGLSYAEAADRMATTVGAVQMLLFRARESLRGALRRGAAAFAPIVRIVEVSGNGAQSPVAGVAARGAGVLALAVVAGGTLAGTDSVGGIRSDRLRPDAAAVHVAVAPAVTRAPADGFAVSRTLPPREARARRADRRAAPVRADTKQAAGAAGTTTPASGTTAPADAPPASGAAAQASAAPAPTPSESPTTATTAPTTPSLPVATPTVTVPTAPVAAPTLPAAPTAALPAAPALPAVPTTPPLPQAPTLPQAPALPQQPQVPVVGTAPLGG